MEQIASAIIAVLLPFIITYFNNKNCENVRKIMLEESQKRVEFLEKYHDVYCKISGQAEGGKLTDSLIIELVEIKSSINSLYKKKDLLTFGHLSVVQRLFLTFKPVSITGWLFSVLFYIGTFFVVFFILGCFINDRGIFTLAQFIKNIQDKDSIIGLIMFVILSIVFRYLSIYSYKKSVKDYL